MTLTPKNWKDFQHYKDRSPAWIKLHRGLLDNVDYFRLSAEAGKALPLIWLLASEKDGLIPEAPEVAFRLRIDGGLAVKILDELTERRFLVNTEQVATQAQPGATLAQRNAAANGFGSRHISDVVKRAVWERDGGKCCACGRDENIEFDHINPVSKGGNSEESNIQLLCRPCNRSKRTQVATHAQPSAEPRGEERTSKVEKEDSRSVVPTRPARTPKQIDLEEAIKAASRFDEFWQAYPRRDGPNPRKPAETRFNALVKTGVDPELLISEIKKLGAEEAKRGNVGTRFIPQAVTWLNQQRWSDHAAVAALSSIGGVKEFTTEDAVRMYVRLKRWPRDSGPEPGLIGCRASPELLAKHGLAPDGRKLETAG